jgi:hypothetical protein
VKLKRTKTKFNLIALKIVKLRFHSSLQVQRSRGVYAWLNCSKQDKISPTEAMNCFPNKCFTQSSTLSDIFVTQSLKIIPVRCFSFLHWVKRFQSARKLLDFQHHLVKIAQLRDSYCSILGQTPKRTNVDVSTRLAAINAQHN